MKLLILLLLCSNAILAQEVKLPPHEKILVADETWVVASGTKSFRVITSNDSISHWFMKRFEKQEMTKFTYTRKKDRKGYYWERSFYFKNEDWTIVALFIKNCFK